MSTATKTSHVIKDAFVYGFKGILLGIANIIPGVSGGTFALILGIYERILNALQSINADAIKTVFALLTKRFNRESRQDFLDLLRRIDALFLCYLGIGAVIAIFALSFLIGWLLSEHPSLTLSFFIGLIIPSIAVPWKMMGNNRSLGSILWIIPGAAVTVLVSLAFITTKPASDNLLWCFISGAIAISAMILPGISGSFVLLVMGQYQNVLLKLQSLLEGLKSAKLDLGSFIWLSVFALGCIAGLIFFARFLNYLMRRFRAPTLAFLIGLIIGSFWVLWPFKEYDQPASQEHNVSQVELSEKTGNPVGTIPGDSLDKIAERIESKQELLIAKAPNIWISKVPPMMIFWNFISLCIGLVGAIGLNYLGKSEIT
ncbi:DUF368 domain-containing protein [bacterium]|nr:DUF368 domain-containing protein [candidate division CSSED10-310 bacterium]